MYDTISFVLCTLLLGHVFNALYMYTAALGHVFSYLRVLVYYFQAQYIAFILNYCLPLFSVYCLSQYNTFILKHVFATLVFHARTKGTYM